MKTCLPLIVAVTLSTGAAFAQAPSRPMPGSGTMSGGASQATVEFVQKAQAGSHFEVDTGNLAAQQAGDAKVKQFGKMMVKDHGAAAKNLAAVIKSDKKAGLPPDTPMTAEQTSEMTKLKGLRGADFDREYVKIMVDDHQKDLEEFQTYAKSGDDPKIKAFAGKTAKVISKHLSHIEQLQNGMNKAAAR